MNQQSERQYDQTMYAPLPGECLECWELDGRMERARRARDLSAQTDVRVLRGRHAEAGCSGRVS